VGLELGCGGTWGRIQPEALSGSREREAARGFSGGSAAQPLAGVRPSRDEESGLSCTLKILRVLLGENEDESSFASCREQ